nr:hypothetical protein [Tanacetum cinerariifolium]
QVVAATDDSPVVPEHTTVETPINMSPANKAHFESEKECRKLKRVKDFAYHKEKMLMCKQAEKGVSLQIEQYDRLADTGEKIDEQELEAYYIYMAKIQEVLTGDTGTDSKPLEQ